MLVDFYFAQKTFFPKNLLPNSGCGLSTDAAYTGVNTVTLLQENNEQYRLVRDFNFNILLCSV